MIELTKNQKLVLDLLQSSKRQMSAYDILDKLRPQGLKAPLQVYRALDKLMEWQLVHKLESLNAFVSCNHNACHSANHGSDMTAFTICDDCGDVTELASLAVSDLLAQQVGKKGFQISQTAIEIKGVCRRCA